MKIITKVILLQSITVFFLFGMLFSSNPQDLYGRGTWGYNGAVSSAKPEASQIGLDILKRGGNAVDAAIAAAFALGVLEPNASGLGGGGFMAIKLAGMDEAVIIDFRETAPLMGSADMYLLDEQESIIGAKAVGIPGETAGLLYALENYGTMSRKSIIEPSVILAENGVEVTQSLYNMVSDNYEKLLTYEGAAEVYLNEGIPYEPGEKILMKDLAKTLRLIIDKGVDGFYKGKTAELIVEEIQSLGGIITLVDMAGYRPVIRKAVEGTYREYKIISSPPPSSGGTHIIQLLNIMENYPMPTIGDNTSASIHAWAQALKLVFADREKYMADTDFIEVPLTGLLSKEYASELFKQTAVKEPILLPSSGDPWKYESGSTTHLSVMDKEGNMVAVTKSINFFFGSGVVPRGTGVLLNNHMNDFTLKGGTANSIEPGKRPLSSMSPTLVLYPDGKPFMTLGSPGATRIISTVAQIISNIIDYGMNLNEAILAPRFYTANSGPLYLESRTSIKAFEELKKMGHEISLKGDYDLYFGGAQGILFDRETGIMYGGADPRRDGKAFAF